MKLLEKLSKKPEKEVAEKEGTKSLAEMIMSKLSKGDFEDGDAKAEEPEEMDPKVVATYKKLGVVMKTYRSGKLPKAFKVIPYTSNWEELLYLTNPSSWSPHATFEATKIFASNLNAKMAQRFYSVVLLENVR